MIPICIAQKAAVLEPPLFLTPASKRGNFLITKQNKTKQDIQDCSDAFDNHDTKGMFLLANDTN